MGRNMINQNLMKIEHFIALYICDSFWIVSKGYKLYKFFPKENKLVYFSRVADSKYSTFSFFKRASRLLRAEITRLYHFQNDTWMCIAKKGIFRYNSASKLFEKCCHIEKGSRPMNLCQTKDGAIYFGEYSSNPNREEMRIFRSIDIGNTWNVAYTFRKGEINHIHGLFEDPYTSYLWVATGDLDTACILGYTKDGFKTFIPLFSGNQQYRACVPLFKENEIIYATDSQYEQNYIRSLNRKTGQITNLQPIQGSGIYAAMGDWGFAVSTSVEPSKVNKDKSSHLWWSKDGHHWVELAAYKKDYLPPIYFQFGSLRFPSFEKGVRDLVFTGRAVCQVDGKTCYIKREALDRVLF